ncbi:MAG: MFS transporter, partial [Acidimicrobiia bacterium]|nr:MFS transporter [Acidimicrobiia bacterium]
MIGILKRRLYSLAFIDEFGPVYAVYTLWFNDNGVTTSQVSTVFLVWALVALLLEIPSGALADRVDRRRLLAMAFGIRAVGIALWLVWPTLTGVFIGAVLWATHDALASGSWEAMIHDELTAVAAADRYGPVMA